MVLLFYLALPTGARDNELDAVGRAMEMLFSGDGVSLYPNPNFRTKNADSTIIVVLFLISHLAGTDGSPHSLCWLLRLQ